MTKKEYKEKRKQEALTILEDLKQENQILPNWDSERKTILNNGNNLPPNEQTPTHC